MDDGIVGRGHVNEGTEEGRCSGGWHQKALALDCMHCGMTSVSSIIHVVLGLSNWLDAHGIGSQSIIHGICIVLGGVYVCMYA